MFKARGVSDVGLLLRYEPSNAEANIVYKGYNVDPHTIWVFLKLQGYLADHALCNISPVTYESNKTPEDTGNSVT